MQNDEGKLALNSNKKAEMLNRQFKINVQTG